MVATAYEPLYVNGKRDKARRYMNLATGDVIARRQYDQIYGRVRGSTYEREANRHERERIARVQRIAARRGDDWESVKDSGTYQELLRQMRRPARANKYSDMPTRTLKQRLRVYDRMAAWEEKVTIGDWFGDDMTADDWTALMSPEHAEE